MTNAERIKALRVCADCTDLQYGTGRERCTISLMRDAADAIERLMDEVEHKETVIQAMLQQSEKQQAEAEKWKQAWATLYDVYANGKRRS